MIKLVNLMFSVGYDWILEMIIIIPTKTSYQLGDGLNNPTWEVRLFYHVRMWLNNPIWLSYLMP